MPRRWAARATSLPSSPLPSSRMRVALFESGVPITIMIHPMEKQNAPHAGRFATNLAVLLLLGCGSGLLPGRCDFLLQLVALDLDLGNLVLRLLERGLHAGHGGFLLGHLAGGLGQLLLEGGGPLAQFFP